MYTVYILYISKEYLLWPFWSILVHISDSVLPFFLFFSIFLVFPLFFPLLFCIFSFFLWLFFSLSFSLCLSVFQFISLFFSLFICLSIFLPSLFLYLFVYLSFCHLSVSLCFSVFLFISLSSSPFLSLFPPPFLPIHYLKNVPSVFILFCLSIIPNFLIYVPVQNCLFLLFCMDICTQGPSSLLLVWRMEAQVYKYMQYIYLYNI